MTEKMQTTRTEVWKFKLEVNEFTQIDMPKGDVLSAHIQRDGVYIWSLVYPDVEYTRKCFFVALTGQELPQGNGELKFIDTVITDSGDYVFHVFEIV